MNWLDTLKTIAPTVATAVCGPLGGAAITALGSVFGVPDATQDAIAKLFKDGQLSQEHLAEIRKLELEYQNNEKERGFKYAELEYKNQDSARQMQMATRSWVPAAISLIVVTGYFAILVGLMFGVLHVTDNQSLLILIGALSTAFGGVLNFWLGSSHGSQAKSEMLANSTPTR